MLEIIEFWLKENKPEKSNPLHSWFIPFHAWSLFIFFQFCPGNKFGVLSATGYSQSILPISGSMIMQHWQVKHSKGMDKSSKYNAQVQ